MHATMEMDLVGCFFPFFLGSQFNVHILCGNSLSLAICFICICKNFNSFLYAFCFCHTAS